MAGFVLLVSGAKEKETFWFFNSILEKSSEPIPFDGLSGFYQLDFPLLIQYMAMFNELFEEYIPELFEHFQNQCMPDQLWLQKWFMSCYLYSFPFGLCVRIWDNLLASGTRFLFNVGLAILDILKEDLLGLDFADINEFFQLMKNDDHCDREILPPIEDVIYAA